MASCLEQYQIKYQGQQYDQESGGRTTTITYQGSFEALREASLNELAVGYIDDRFGTIDSSSLQQGEGPFWELIVVYKIDYPDFDFDSDDDVASGDSTNPLHSELTVRMISRDIETHENYHRIWNYNLWGIDLTGHNSFPTETIKRLINNVKASFPADYAFTYLDNQHMWIFSINEPEEFVKDNIAYKWTLIFPMEKPGVTSYDFPTYEMTQYGRFKEKDKATKLVTNQIGKIVKPKKGDFGVNKALAGNWLCEGADIRHDGKSWVGTITYLHSADDKGWDPDIYEGGRTQGIGYESYSPEALQYIRDLHRLKAYREKLEEGSQIDRQPSWGPDELPA